MLSGHADGSVVRFFFEDDGSGEAQVSHTVIRTGKPYCDKDR